MAVTQNTYTGNGSTVLFSFTFPYLETTDIKVSVNGTITTAYTLANATTVQFNTAPANGAAIRIFRQTDDADLAATFYPGSAIRSQDLNENFTQNLYVTQEANNNVTAALDTSEIAASDAASAVSTANTALSNSTAAVSTANSASSAASSAVSTANSAVSTANSAVSTANSAVSTANSALSVANAADSVADLALATAQDVVDDATNAVSIANQALDIVAGTVQFTGIPDVASIPPSPDDLDGVQILDSTGIESFTPLSGLPGGFVGSAALFVRLQYNEGDSTWEYAGYGANDPDVRYLRRTGGTMTGAILGNNSTSASTPGFAFDGDANTGIGRPGADELALITGGSARVTLDSAGAVAIPGSLAVTGALTKGGNNVVTTGDTGSVTSTMLLDGTILNADVNASAAIAGTKISPDFGSQNVTTTGTATAASLNPTGSTVPANGVYLPAANTVGVATNSTKRIEIEADGDINIDSGGVFYDATNNRLAIGSNAPSATLSLGSNTPTHKLLLFDDGGGNTRYGFSIQPGEMRQYSASNGSLTFGTVSVSDGSTWSEKARLTSDGKFLVGTSSARSDFIGLSPRFQIEGTDQDTSTITVTRNSGDEGGAALLLAKSRGATAGAVTVVQNNDLLGGVYFMGADGTNVEIGAQITAAVDGTPGNNDLPSRLVFSTTADGASSPTERMRIGQNGFVKASEAASYIGAGGLYHEFNTNAADYTLQARSTNASPIGVHILYSAASPNGTGNNFLVCDDSTTSRAVIRSNGGLANYSANNVNLSDRNAKKDIAPVVGTWDCLKEWEIVNFRYKDQPDDADLNMGVIAQQVAESCPEVITVFQEATEDQPEKLGVKDQQMMWMAIKALQEAQVRIETLEAEVAALKAS